MALLDIDLIGSNQVVVDIHSRFLFESELFARRQRLGWDTWGDEALNHVDLGGARWRDV